mmetsp:Transcript_983/g.3611  ORF Transcript_983/g.3611 Transcript_983/m.3611 type:complete len:178 (-) Transcript_983:710-1243(-)
MPAKKRTSKPLAKTSKVSIAHRLSGARGATTALSSRLGTKTKIQKNKEKLTTTPTGRRTNVIARLGDASIASRLGDVPQRRQRSATTTTTTTKRKKSDDLRARLMLSKTKPKTNTATVAPAIRKMLQELDLQRFLPKFAREEVDVRALKVMKDADYRALNIPVGPAAKIRDFARKIR